MALSSECVMIIWDTSNSVGENKAMSCYLRNAKCDDDMMMCDYLVVEKSQWFPITFYFIYRRSDGLVASAFGFGWDDQRSIPC